MKLIGAQVICESLVREGVDTVFGIPGGGVIHLYHALPEYPIHHVLMRHEQAAIHAADGYTRATGRMGACIATSGPGATNLLTGLATALRDSSPIVAITGQAPAPVVGTDAFQEVDVTGVTMPVTKHNYLVTDGNELDEVLREAFHVARTGRPGPVLVCVTTDVQAAVSGQVYPKEDGGLRSGPMLRRSSASILPERWDDDSQRSGQSEPEMPNGLPLESGDPVEGYVGREIQRVTKGKALLVTDLGPRRAWGTLPSVREDSGDPAGQHGPGTPGSALPAAIGAQLGIPGKPVWVLVAARSFEVTIQELAVVVQEQLPIRILVLNCGSPDGPGPHLVRIAEAYGIRGLRVDRNEDISSAITKAMTADGPILVGISSAALLLPPV